jgi:hypothetical protein
VMVMTTTLLCVLWTRYVIFPLDLCSDLHHIDSLFRPHIKILTTCLILPQFHLTSTTSSKAIFLPTPKM